MIKFIHKPQNGNDVLKLHNGKFIPSFNGTMG